MTSECSCSTAGATQLDILDRLVNVDGMDQMTACRMLWGHGTPEFNAMDVRVAGMQAAEYARERLGKAFRWLDVRP